MKINSEQLSNLWQTFRSVQTVPVRCQFGDCVNEAELVLRTDTDNYFLCHKDFSTHKPTDAQITEAVNQR